MDRILFRNGVLPKEFHYDTILGLKWTLYSIAVIRVKTETEMEAMNLLDKECLERKNASSPRASADVSALLST